MQDNFIDLIPEATFILNEAGIMVDLNPAAELLSGYRRSLLENSESISPFSLPASTNWPVNNEIDSGNSIRFRAELQTHFGKRTPLDMHARKISYNGAPHCIITCRPAAENISLGRQQIHPAVKFLMVFHSSPDPILISEVDSGKIDDFNHAFTQAFGFTREEAIGRSTLDIELWPTPETRISSIDLLKQTGFINNQEIQLRSKSGNLLTLLASSTIMSLDGIKLMVTHLKDISRRKEMESALAASEARYRQFADQLPLGIVITQDGLLKYVNEALAQMMGYGLEEMVNTSFIQYIHEDDRMRVIENHRRRMQGESVESPYRLKLVTKSGEVRQCTTDHSNIEWEGRVSGLGVITDITERALFEEQMKRSIRLLQEKEVAKTRFLAAASHDLRQPLHAMGLFVSALQERVKEEEARKLVHQLDASTEALRGLLNSLLDISKLDAGVIQPNITTTSAQDIFDRLHLDYQPSANEKKLSLRFIRSQCLINTDSLLLEQILRNLLSNAIRYTQHGGILVGGRRRGHTFRFEIWDTGIGIAGSELKNVFQEFYQIGNPERDRGQGLGLGLAIAQRLANLLDLSIEVRSIPGAGSVFSVAVPLGEKNLLPEANQPAILRKSLNNALILVIDDERAIREATRVMLEDWGCRVIDAGSAESALKKLSANDCIPDAVIADYRLRDNMTGADAIRLLHSMLNRAIPAIIITGDTDPARLKEAKESGCHLLHKPLAPAKLRTLLSHLLG